ncbi:MAG: glycoside hydrolase family 3 C-terminal domain-containing protein, partial [Eubacterium sp.]|nr:glycoside hydrolase family 3 C-terminal domain-containing protein [Eubacterium sp.]
MAHWVRARFTPNLPLGKDGRRVTASAEHAAVSREAAKEGMVLLKNRDHVLPLQRGARVALFGKGTIDYVKGGGGSGDVAAPYVHNILDGLLALRDEVSVFQESAAFYKDYVQEQYSRGGIPGLIPEPELPENLAVRASAWTDTAIVSFSRYSGEGWDRKSDFGGPAFEPEDGFTHIHLADRIFAHSDFYLTEAEQQMLHVVTAHFPKVIVLLNVGGMIDTRWIRDNADISAALITWQGGMEGGDAAAELLMGHGNPSGKLADTFAGTLEDYPSTEGFHASDDYVDYTEDIYVGYRYFETIPKEAEKVVYPFGFGLSYTTFMLSDVIGWMEPAENTDQFPAGDLERKQAKDNCQTGVQGNKTEKLVRNPGNIHISLCVTNTGSCSGKEVVQLYYSAPQGLLGKPSRVLGAYQKTRLLQPGESQRVELVLPAARMSSYDDLGKVQKSAWVLEAGTYHFYVGTDVRGDLQPLSRENLQSQFRYGAKVQEADCKVQSDEIFTWNLAYTVVTEQCQPRLVPEKLSKRMLSDGTFESLPVHEQPDPDENIFTPLKYPEEIECVAPETRYRKSYKTFEAPERPQLADVAEGKITRDDFIRSLSDEDLAWLLSGTPNTGCANTFGWGNLPEAGVPNIMTEDGPAGVRFDEETGVRTTAFPCATLLACTWNPDVVYTVGAAGGEEARENNIYVWLTPAVNIHRSPLCGRNFEYYSEDPLLAGKQAAAMVHGIQSSHVSACLKHFALNDKETNRKNSDSRVSERAAREIYLRQFEIVIREANPGSVMTSYNLINGHRASENFDLLNGILRGEWNYDGTVTTDWWGRGEQYKECVAGNDVKMGCGFPERLLAAKKAGAVTRE